MMIYTGLNERADRLRGLRRSGREPGSFGPATTWTYGQAVGMAGLPLMHVRVWSWRRFRHVCAACGVRWRRATPRCLDDPSGLSTLGARERAEDRLTAEELRRANAWTPLLGVPLVTPGQAFRGRGGAA